MTKILLIDDEPDVRHVTDECLSVNGFNVEAPAVEHPDVSRAAAAAAISGDHDLIILDLRLPYLDPFELIQTANELRESPPIMILAGFLSLELESRLRALGVRTFLTKPFTFADLNSSVRECLTTAVPIRN